MRLFRRKPEPQPEPDLTWDQSAISHAVQQVADRVPDDSVFTQTDPAEPWTFPTDAPRMISASEAHVLAADPDAWQRHRTAQLAALSEPTEEHPLTDTAAQTPAAVSPDDTGSHHLPEAADSCPACHGTGRVLTTRNWLDEIVSFLPTDDAAQLDSLIAEFYHRLVQAAPYLGPLFPADLTTGDALNSKGNRQRDQLLGALVDILTMYDPDHPESAPMLELESKAEQWGRSHANFARPDGQYGATPDEYLLVRDVLGRLMVDVVGAQWEAGHATALILAYHEVMDIMRDSQRRWLKTHPAGVHARAPRQAEAR